MELNQQQQIAAEYDKSHVLVLAGAGTGKTRTIIAKAAHLIKQGVESRRILLLTFTRRAAAEMVHRLDQIIGESASRIQAGTFHHFCLYSMRRMPNQFGIEQATVIDRDDQVQLMKLIRGSFRSKGEKIPRSAELVNLCSYARNTNQSTRDYLNLHSEYDEDMIEIICQIGQGFNKRKEQNNYLDYDDILHRFAKRLHENPSLGERLRGFYDHILVDEMQDTNPLQWLILDGLRDPAKLFCVGDDAQSIYAFRGADFKNVHSFTERIADATVLRLEENYRSTQGILDLSNWLLDESPIKYDKKLTAFRKTKSRPQLMDFDSDFDEADWIAKDLLERHETGANWHDHMIITRTAFGARTVESSMVEKNIPYRFVGGTSLLEAAHVKDLFSLVRSAANHHDELAWARYLTQWPKIGDVTAARLIKGMREQGTLEEALTYLQEALKGRDEILKGPRVVLDFWDDPSNAIQYAGRFLVPIMKQKYDNWERRLKDFELLVRLAEKHKSIMAFIETYILDPISSTMVQRLDDEDTVTLTTVHSSKGTESQVCYLIRVQPGMYPHIRSLESREQIEEERRILYVAMTRAQDELILTRAPDRRGQYSLPYSATTELGDEAGAYFFQDLTDEYVDKKMVGLRPNYFSNYDVISPRRRW